mgnify:CR=1 FL=1
MIKSFFDNLNIVYKEDISLRKEMLKFLQNRTIPVKERAAAVWEFIRIFQEEMDETTVIIIAQRVASVKNADRIMIINDGIVEAIAPHDELIQTNATYQEIYNSQLKKDGE